MPAPLGRRTIPVMNPASWTYELPATGAASEGLEDYEIRTADGEHVGVGLGLVGREGALFVLVDAGALPPFVHRRIAVPWRHVADVDHAALVVRLSVDRAGLDGVALALDPKRAVHGPGAEAARAELPAALTRPAAPGAEGPIDRYSAIPLALLAAAAPFSLFVLVTIWMTRGLEGWEFGLLAIPFVLAALTVALEGYRLFREPHVGHHLGVLPAAESRSSAPPRAAHRLLGGRSELVLFAIGGGVLYLTTQLAVTVALGERLPLLGWIGFAVASTIVLGASTILAIFLVRSSVGVGSEPPREQPKGTPGVHRVLVIADEGCSGESLCRPLAERLEDRRTEVLVVAPTLVSGFHYLDSDVDAARRAAQARLVETVDAFRLAGIVAQGEVGSESPLEAIADALAVFAADEIVVATPPPERTSWLERGVVERARELYERPVSRLVVEPPAPIGIRAR
jgi:hypothetical protein